MRNLPPLGSTVRIVSVGLRIWTEAEKFIDADCTLCAVFMTGDTQMVAVEHQADAVCCCFVADMVRTPDQITAEQREKEIDEIHKICIEGFPGSTRTGELNRTISDCACIIYKAGYRKQVAP